MHEHMTTSVRVSQPLITSHSRLASGLVNQWDTKADDYGRTYYANWESGEAVYDQPPEMKYRPPLGRNELGEKVDPRLQALR